VRVDLCAVVLAAGYGKRLRPLTERVPKALCPVGNRPLLEHALERLARLELTGRETVAVNACYLADQVVAQVGDRAHRSVEPGPPLGTAGALGNLKEWIAGRGVLVGNADAYLAPEPAEPGGSDLADLAGLLDGWDGTTVRLLGVPAAAGRGEFGGYCFAGFSLLPATDVAVLPAEPADLVRTTWRPAERAGRLEVIEYRGRYLDTGTPADYLAANLHAAQAAPDWNLIAPGAVITGRSEHSVIGANAVVAGAVTRCVVWPGARVEAGEGLIDAIRARDGSTVSASRAPVG